MGDDIKLNVYYGGTMEKTDDGSYWYNSQLGNKTVVWNTYEINWNRFKDLMRAELISAPINWLWYKDAKLDMKYVNYACHFDGDLFGLRRLRKTSELDIFVEHGIPEGEGCDGDDEHDEESASDEDDDEHDDDGEMDRPKEPEEPEESEDERLVDENLDEQETHANTGNRNGNVGVEGVENENQIDHGDEVVVDVGDGRTDERFKAVFEEGLTTRVDPGEAYTGDSDEESNPEFGLGDEMYPDTPLESEEEWEQWNDPKKKRSSKYHGDYDKEPYIWLFQKFNSGMEVKDQLLRYSLNTQYDIKMAKSEANRIAVVCCADKCKWRVYCSYEVPIKKWMVKVCINRHNHGKSSRVSMLKQGVIAGLFREELRRNPNLQAAEIKDTIKERYNIVVPISKCYRGRRIALDTILQAQAVEFAKLWDYEAQLRKSNPGITTEINTSPVNGIQIFENFYICFEPLRRSWKTNCRPVIGLDGCFLKWELKGDLLAAVGRDADNKMYPIAWAVVKGETTDTWTWFVSKLKADLDLGMGQKLTIISDKSKGLLNAISNELPEAEHRMCARHIYANFKKSFSRSEYKNLFWGVAYSYHSGEYDENMKLVEAYDPAAHAALLLTEPHKWCRAFFSLDSHCADVHNNLSEAFNRTIKIARAKPVVSMLEDIRLQAMDRNTRRFLKARSCDTVLTPITMALLEKSRMEKKYCKTHRSSSTLYEVDEFNCGYTVSVSTHECACRKWDLTGIPCKHAVCVLDDNQEDPVNYVPEYYYATVLRNTYDDNIRPVNGEVLWEKTHKPPIGIPEVRKPRGRKKKRNRIQEPFESLQTKGKATKHGRIPHCSNCGGAGHIKRGCKNEKVVVEGPKNRRGRPRKHPDECIPKRPTKPRKKRITPEAASSTQPLPQGESTSSFPASSTAPQPSLSSKKTKPHVKQPPRKKPLNITKKLAIPNGTGVFWSPYTNRPFEVIGNRMYDRSMDFPQSAQPPQHAHPETPQPPL